MTDIVLAFDSLAKFDVIVYLAGNDDWNKDILSMFDVLLFVGNMV